VDTADGFGKDGCHFKRLELFALFLVLLLGHGRGHGNLVQHRLVDEIERVAREDAVRDDGVDLCGATRGQDARGHRDCLSRVDDVVNDDSNLFSESLKKDEADVRTPCH